MADGPSYSFAIVCDALGDRETAASLADRVLCAEIDWLAPVLESTRAWRGLGAGESHLEWKHVPTRARAAKIRAHGRFTGHGGHVVREALYLFLAADRPPDAVVLLLDADGNPQRAVGLEAAREAHGWAFPVVIGIADLERESWVLAGFEPRDARERAHLAAETAALGFEPHVRPASLTGRHDHDRLSPKRVLRALTGGDHSREAACWLEADLALLRVRGADNGLAKFLDEVVVRLVPVVAGPSAANAVRRAASPPDR